MARNLRNTLKEVIDKNALPIEEVAFYLSIDKTTLINFLNKKCLFPEDRLLHLTQVGIFPEPFIRKPYIPKVLCQLATTILFLPDAETALDVLHVPEDAYVKLYNNCAEVYTDKFILDLYATCPELPFIDISKILGTRREMYAEMMNSENTATGEMLRRVYKVFPDEGDFVDFDNPIPTATEEALREEIHKMMKQHEKLQRALAKSKEELKSTKAQIKELEKQNAELYDALQNKSNEVYALENTVNSQRDSVSQIDDLKQRIYEQDITIEQLSKAHIETRDMTDVGCRELYSGELDMFITDAIKAYINNNTDRLRRVDLLEEFLSVFVKTDVDKTKQDVRKSLDSLEAYLTRSFIPPTTISFGVVSLIPRSINGHPRFTINGDERYCTTVSSTPSEYRGNKNQVKQINKSYF